MAFGTDAPVEPIDPWPGIALAVRREDRAGRPAPRPCPRAGPAARSGVRGRLRRPGPLRAGARSRTADVGQRADIVVIPAASVDEPVTPGGALSTTRPSHVLMDGEVVFER